MGHATDQPATSPSPRTEPWEPGIIARYLTAAGATVDLTYNDDTADIRAECGGELCHWSDNTNTEGRFDDTATKAKERFDEWLPIAQRRAQAHAETCRALSRPAVNA